jgi:hypothetical protein
VPLGTYTLPEGGVSEGRDPRINRIAGSDASIEGGIVKRIILKRLLLLAAMAIMAPVTAITATTGMADTSTEQNIGEGVTQDSSSGSESGDADQTLNVAGSGDNSDQCTGVQGAGNTAPLEGSIDLLQNLSEAKDFVFEDVGGSDLNILQSDAKAGNFDFHGGGEPLTVDGTNESSCDQQASQTGSASG